MNTKKKKNSSSMNFGRLSLPIFIYIAICAAALLILINFFNTLIENHDRVLSQQMCSLLNEKVTSSLKYLTDSASDLSDVIAHDTRSTYFDVYDRLKNSKVDASYTSIGIILDDRIVYAAPAERTELEKQGLVTTALALDGTVISKPYRSVMDGQMVFTVLSSITREGERAGTLFVTYHFSDIVELAYSDNIDKNAEIWLMDVQSLNYIRCSGPEGQLTGNWSNLNLNDDVSKNSDFMECIDRMRKGANTASVTYTDDKETFTQVFAKIDYIDGLSVVVRIPNKAFSRAISSLRSAVRDFSLVFICATFMLLIVFRVRSAKEKKVLEKLTREVIKAFATAVDFKDPYTAGHSKRVGEYSREIARRLGMKETECTDIYYSGLLHDVGKLGIDNTIINKPASLSDAEFAEIKKHPDMGYEILKGISLRESYAAGAKYHHERIDGTGYPGHETEIPLVARIISVADAYDAMTSKRSYRDALPQEVVREQIEKNIGTQFDEKIAKIMLQMIDEDTEYEMRQK